MPCRRFHLGILMQQCIPECFHCLKPFNGTYFFISTASIVSPFLHPPLWLFAPVPDECWPDQRLFPSGSVGDMGQDHFF